MKAACMAGGEVGGGDVGGLPEQAALLVLSCLFNVTALTDITRPGGCLEDIMLVKFCTAQLCAVIKMLYYLYGPILGRNTEFTSSECSTFSL